MSPSLKPYPSAFFFTGTYGVSSGRRDTSTGEGIDVETTVEVVPKHSRPACFSRLKGQEREAAGVSILVWSDREKIVIYDFPSMGFTLTKHLNYVW